MRIVPIEDIVGMVGTEVGRSEWLTIDQDRISQFADATLDHQWIHIDPETAAKGPYGATIAHGYLTLALLPYLGTSSAVGPEGMTMAINYGSDKVRFLNPVVVGSRIRSVTTLKDFTERGPGRYLSTNNVVIEIDGVDTPALIADTLTLFVMEAV